MNQKLQERLGGVEWLRLLASFGIVWFHTEEARWRSFGYSGLPAFLLIFCFLIVFHYNELPFKLFIYRRASRLLLPWISWSLIYIVAKLIKYFLFHDIPSKSIEIQSLLIGGNIHLWYLPFSFLASVLLYFLCYFLLKIKIGYFFIIGNLGLCIIILFICSFLMDSISLGPPFLQWLFALPSLPLGFCLGIIMREFPAEKQSFLFGCVLVVVVVSLIAQLLVGQSLLLIPYSIGISLTVLALQLCFPFKEAAIKAGQLTYGIYLIHPLIYYFVRVLFGDKSSFIIILSTFFVSAVLVAGMKKTYLRKII